VCRLAALVCVAVISAGCGTEVNKKSEPVPKDEPRPAETAPTQPGRPSKEARSATSFFAVGAEEGEEPRPVKDLYGVFSRPANSRDRALENEVAAFAEGCGEAIPGQARVLIAGIGAEDLDLVAVPTSEGSVAYGLLPMGGGGCGRTTLRGLMLGGEISSDGVRWYGLVPDDVESVEVVLDGVSHKGHIAHNGFVVEVKGASEKDTGRIVVHWRDGTTQKF
jgi:hypothetical protein